MRRERLYAAIEEVGQALRTSGLADAFAELLLPAASDELNRRRAAMLAGLKHYVIAAERFSEPASELARILGMRELEDTALWLDVLSLGQSPERKLREWQQRIQFVEQMLPRISSLLRPEPLRALMEPGGEEEPLFTDDALLTVIVIEHDRKYSSPERLVEVFQSVSLLYGACAELEGLPSRGLSVLACDSGVDKAFDFLGASRAIELSKEVLLSLWDSVVLHRGDKLANRVKLVAGSLPVIQRVVDLEQAGKLTREQADGLRLRITEAATKFLLGGAMIPEIERLSYSPRELMAPNQEPQRATPVAEATGGPRELSLESLSDSDRAALIRLLEQARSEEGVGEALDEPSPARLEADGRVDAADATLDAPDA